MNISSGKYPYYPEIVAVTELIIKTTIKEATR